MSTNQDALYDISRVNVDISNENILNVRKFFNATNFITYKISKYCNIKKHRNYRWEYCLNPNSRKP